MHGGLCAQACSSDIYFIRCSNTGTNPFQGIDLDANSNLGITTLEGPKRDRHGFVADETVQTNHDVI